MAETVEDVGLLLVHGMGEQKRQEHLKTTARELASYIGQSKGLIRLSITDSTEQPPRRGHAPIVIDAQYAGEGGRRRVRLHLHEAWWADLGIKGGLLEHVKFWFWGLGQWAAQVVRRDHPGRNTARLMAMPRFPYQASDRECPSFLRRVPARATLWAAALLAILTFFTWSAAKRVIALLASRIPEPGLIFLFLGDVKIFERPAGPGKGTLLDPDMPMRATIRRRIVTAMTQVAAQPYDRWYMLAHSLGTVPAWNGLQELEVTLANYLTEEDWKALPGRFKTVQPFTPPGDHYTTNAMMPRRPPWLADTDGIRRPVLFERFRGFISYGSPLDKFAALWPRIVCLNRQAEVFRGDAEWINLYDPTDPVSGKLDAFAAPLTKAADPSLPLGKALIPANVACRSSRLFGVSHVRYFKPRRAKPSVAGFGIVEAIMTGGSLASAVEPARISGLAFTWRGFLAAVQLAALALILLGAAAALLLGLGKLLPDSVVPHVKWAIGRIDDTLLRQLEAGGWQAFRASAKTVVTLALLATLVSGAARFLSDAWSRFKSGRRRERRKRRLRRRLHRRNEGPEVVRRSAPANDPDDGGA